MGQAAGSALAPLAGPLYSIGQPASQPVSIEQAGGLPGDDGGAPAGELASLDYAVVASGLVVAALLALLLQAPEASHPLLTLPLLPAL